MSKKKKKNKRTMKMKCIPTIIPDSWCDIRSRARKYLCIESFARDGKVFCGKEVRFLWFVGYSKRFVV